ncbi:MAG: MerR family transcriptional regulator [Nitriliruptoraceae bacterium]|nr:MerR family transcriptional regulator [Nitriliruptoraceae bacterium]
MADDRSVLRIGEVSRRTGVAVPTLRAWERRYGLLDPARTDGGHRLYSEDDISHVRAMQRLLDEGWSAAAAAREVLREPASVTQLRAVPTAGDAASDLIDRLEGAIDNFDAPSADVVVDDLLARLDIPSALDQVILPVLRRVGEGWQDDPRIIAREHFATNTLRPRLQRLLRTGARSASRAILAAAPEGEDHDLGLLAGAVVAADAGWRVHYLGARMPTSAMLRSAAELAPEAILIGAMHRKHADAFLRGEPNFEASAVVLGGTGFIPYDAARIANAVVHQGPISELSSTLERAMAARRTG